MVLAPSVRIGLVVLMGLSALAAGLVPPLRRRPAMAWLYAELWLAVACAAWAGVAHASDQPPAVTKLLLVGFVELVCLQVWLRRATGDDRGGGGGPSPAPEPPPPEFDWDRFERDFRRWAARRPRQRAG